MSDDDTDDDDDDELGTALDDLNAVYLTQLLARTATEKVGFVLVQVLPLFASR
jgi:hypothetical protein